MMAGQIEEPISFSFQADSIHSGSISFGRFANEPLLWERRSSFSHNRIQDEVARCSKHRIVTQKKAYFEAQFKRKALLRQSSLDAQSGLQYEASVEKTSDSSHVKDYGFVQEYKNDASSDTSVYIGYTENYDYGQEAQVNLHFDESSDGSNNLEEQGMMEYNIEGKDILISEPLKLPSADCVEAKAKVNDGTITALDAQTVIDCGYSRCDSAEHDVEVELSIDAYKSYVDEECNAIGLCAGSWDAENKPDAVSHFAVVCPEIVVSTEPSETESNVRSSQTQRDSVYIAAEASSRNLKRVGKQSATETKTLKHSKIIPSPANKLARPPNPERLLMKSTSSISKTTGGHKSSAIKEIRVVKVTKSPHTTTTMKDVPNAHHNQNRTGKLIAPIYSSLKTGPTSIRSRSNLQEEQKKEMLSRLGQTKHIQKTEVNRSLAGVQGQSPDESKQVGRGLSIKPKPTPSLHSKDDRLISKSKNAVANRPQVNPSYPKTKVVDRPSTNLKAENGLLKPPFQVSTITSHPRKKLTKTSAVSSLMNKSIHLSSKRNAVVTNGMAGNGEHKAGKLNSQTVPPRVEAIKGRLPQPISEKTKKYTVRNVTEKPRLQEMRQTTAKVC